MSYSTDITNTVKREGAEKLAKEHDASTGIPFIDSLKLHKSNRVEGIAPGQFVRRRFDDGLYYVTQTIDGKLARITDLRPSPKTSKGRRG
jgi:hypothetical protein